MESSSKRLPVSCENCRQRKIRCLNSEEKAPCDTCVRRGYAATCTFRRESVSQAPPPSGELLKQISDLSSLLRQNISLTTASLEQQRTVRSLVSPESEPPKETTYTSGDAQVFPTGRLLTSASNHVRCLPFNRVGDANLLESIQEPACSPFPGFPFATGISRTQRGIFDSMPSFDVCDKLKDIFLNVFSPLFHILHEPTFEAKYRAFKQDPQSTPLSFLALLFVIFSLSVTSLDDHDPLIAKIGLSNTQSGNSRSFASRYRSAAMECLSADDFMSQHNLCTLQSLVLLIYALSHAGGPTWSLLGSTLHIAIAIGCSVDPDQLNVGIIEAEERRRCWAALTMLYTIQSTCFGKIMPFRIQADVALPANVDDEDLIDGTSASTRCSREGLTQMSYLLCKFRLYNLGFEICRISSSSLLPSRDIVVKLDEQLGMELKSHMSLFENVIDIPFYHVAHFYIISNYTHHLVLLLHRPYLGTVRAVQPDEPLRTHVRDSCQRCNESAMKILSNFESFHHNPQLKPYHWYINGFGSFQTFMAITTLLVLIAKTELSPTVKLAMTTAIKTCMNIFRDMSERSEMCAKALAVLEPSVGYQLSDMQGKLQKNTFATTPSSVSDCSIPDTWNHFPQLDAWFRDISSDQWLLPAGFPWRSLH
ncbi:hypothetical protein AN2780.2 [Paecilomyces variotii No. 5]|uniref:Zn(2)-C6 fungal-type domain-containing protein n=1 Tax=Byssochlamys spectabilis (strain No. 5 / NBRC 109023) TaxID=1356009 RepID=V5G9C1_BYSSN|nr:hypothetical protein AN2780.2 [Paecilomyces variotii No. 5]